MQSNETNPTWYFGLGHEGHLSNFDLSKVNDLHSTSYEICRTLGASSRTCLLIRKHRIQTPVFSWFMQSENNEIICNLTCLYPCTADQFHSHTVIGFCK